MKKLLLFVLAIVLATTVSAQLKQNFIDPRTTGQKYAALMQLIGYYYVEDVDQAKITEEAIIAALKELDPHSVYIPKAEVQRTNEPLVGNFEGIGVQFQIYKDTIMVISPIVGGPSDKLGIRAGDKIIRINGESACGPKINNQYVFDRLRGPKGTTVDLSIYRKGVRELIDYSVTRDKIPINSIDATYMVSPTVGYIKLSRFARSSHEEFVTSINELKSKGMQDLIFDLRGNSGGYLDVATELADEFLSSGKLIVYTKGIKSPRQEYNSTGGGVFENGKLIVLIDEGSASASEIVSGAIQDWDRGIIMGRRSFGKGLVQRPFMLPDSSMVRLTTARYYTPSGRCIQKPYADGDEAYRKEVYERVKHGEMLHADSIHFPDSLKYYTQNKRLVYGGGGVMPDFFIPLDTAFASKYYTDIFRKGLLNEYVLQYIDNNRAMLKSQYPDYHAWQTKFNKETELLDEFVKFADTKGVPASKEGLAASGPYMKTLMNALIARNLYNQNAFYQSIAKTDDDLQRAAEAMGKPGFFNVLK